MVNVCISPLTLQKNSWNERLIVNKARENTRTAGRYLIIFFDGNPFSNIFLSCPYNQI